MSGTPRVKEDPPEAVDAPRFDDMTLRNQGLDDELIILIEEEAAQSPSTLFSAKEAAQSPSAAPAIRVGHPQRSATQRKEEPSKGLDTSQLDEC